MTLLLRAIPSIETQICDQAKAQTIYKHLSCKTVEVVPFQDIGDIYNVSTGRDVNEFIIRRNRNGGTLYFSSAERDAIVKVCVEGISPKVIAKPIRFRAYDPQRSKWSTRGRFNLIKRRGSQTSTLRSLTSACSTRTASCRI